MGRHHPLICIVAILGSVRHISVNQINKVKMRRRMK
uniref:Uncharacterized protein n=1 Tax=Rhizophora mucronata TaxID=61149 RepID=A0A2P2R029_RHIMU